ncbi:hypothetical protein [Brachybacterium sp. GCM10030252]|uniref:5-methylcytosine restriction system specificity protein McrC n=1 Tax=Brachybacterium sp. GCM10030252 TaxID=3273380 RepID=UPI003615DF23
MIKDLTSETHWDRPPTQEEQHWLASITELSPEPFVLNAQLQMDHAPTIEPVLTRDLDGWRANRYIGEIRHQGRTLVIQPRLGVGTIMSWISTILNVQVLPRTATQSTGVTSAVTQLLAALWRASILTAGQHALPRTGRKVSSRGVAVKGRLDVGATARRRAAGHRDLVSTRVVRTYDNAPASAVVLADRYFDRHLSGARWRGSRLDEQLAVLRAATGPRPAKPSLHDIRSTRYSPITVKWRRAAELSWRILNEDPLGVAADDESTHGVLIDVAELWELFVLHCAGLATEQPVRHGTTTRTSGHLARSTIDPDRRVGKLYPDVMVGEKPITAVLDAKYKRLGSWRGIDREDLYQLHAYSSSFAAPLAALAYPVASGQVPDDELYSPWKTNTGTLSFLTLPTEKEACVAKLATWFGNGGVVQ